MITLQELISRARFIFQDSPKRRKTFELCNGKRSAREISRLSRRGVTAVLNELQKMKDLELVRVVTVDGVRPLKKDGSLVYEKVPLIRHVSSAYFDNPGKLPVKPRVRGAKKLRNVTARIKAPSEQEILDICKSGEDQLYEFKAAGTEMRILSKEIAAFANTESGGILFYGIDDDGTIDTVDQTRQRFDQSLRNSVRSNISPALSIQIVEKDVVGHKIFLILVPPWNRKDVYHYEGKVCIRNGTNAFAAKPEESKLLHAGKIVF